MFGVESKHICILTLPPDDYDESELTDLYSEVYEGPGPALGWNARFDFKNLRSIKVNRDINDL